jgi:hypothetical protein
MVVSSGELGSIPVPFMSAAQALTQSREVDEAYAVNGKAKVPTE